MTTFVGRRQEERAVVAGLDTGGAVALVGPAGIGKTTLAGRVLASRAHVVGGGLALVAERRYFALERALRQTLAGEPEAVAERVLEVLDGRILFVDDVHWIDAATAEVVQLLVGHAPILATSRSEQLGPAARAWPDQVEQIHLAPLPPSVARRLARLHHPRLDDAGTESLLAAAHGSPLLIETLASDTALSPTLGAALASRLDRLEDSDRDALGRLALMGCPTAQAVVGLAPGSTAGDLLRWESDLVDFSHRLVGEAVAELLDAGARRRLHADLADHLPDEEAARHELAAGRDDLALGRASRAAAATTDVAIRADLLLVAAQACPNGDPRSDRCWLDAAEALVDADRWSDALASAARVGDGAPELAAEAALHRGRALWFAGDLPAARAAFEDGMLAIGETGTDVAARLMLERAYLAVRHETSGRVAAAQGALDAAERAGKHVLRARATLGAALLYEGQPGWESLLEEVAEAAFRAGDVELSCNAAYHLASGLGFMGRLEEGTSFALRQGERARAHGLSTWETHFASIALVNRGLAGGWARWVLDEAPAFLAAHPVFRNRFQAHLALVLALSDLGRPDDARHRLELMAGDAASPEAELFTAIARAELAWLAGDLTEGRAAVEQARTHGDAWFGVRIMAEVAMAHLAVEHDEPFVAELPSTTLPELWAALHDLAGLQAWLEGDTATAVAELERAVSAWDDVALTRFAVRSAITAALVAQRLGRRDGASRRAAAVELARRGQHAAVLQRIGEARVEGLTAREEAVMLLVAEGRTSGDVAAELDISAATVESHVRSACRKLGAPSRREAALQVSQRA